MFNIGPYGENVSKRFFSEKNWTVETKLPRNVHWMVLYKLYVFCSDMKFKMAATAGLSLTLSWIFDQHKKQNLCRGPSNDYSWAVWFQLSKWFQIKAKLYMNVHWMVLYKPYVFCSDMKFKMAATAELSLTLHPMGLSSAVAAILNFTLEQKTLGL
jgi:hypothetical protein